MKPRGKFDEAFRAWAGRPAPMSVDRVVAGVRDRRQRPSFGPRRAMAWAAVTVAMIVIGTGAAWWLTPRETSPVNAPRTASRLVTPSADSDVVVVWLDDQTPVHVFLTDASARGDQ